MFTASVTRLEEGRGNRKADPGRWACQVKKLVDEAFEAEEAGGWDRLEIHLTPKHGSWLNMGK